MTLCLTGGTSGPSGEEDRVGEVTTEGMEHLQVRNRTSQPFCRVRKHSKAATWPFGVAVGRSTCTFCLGGEGREKAGLYPPS